MNDIVLNLVNSPLGDVAIEISLVRILLALVFGYFLGALYRKTHSGISYSSNFTFTILSATLLSAAIIIIVGENVARAFALVGALAIIRFRTVVKDPKDLTFIFAALVTGMAVGVGLLLVALFVFIVFTISAIVVSSGRIFAVDDFEHIIRFSGNSEIDIDRVSSILQKHVDKTQLLGMEILKELNQFTATFEISAISEKEFSKLQKDITSIEDFKMDVSFVTGNSSITY